MRTKHTSHSLSAFPIYSSAFVSPTELVLGGGGGQSRSGIKNKLRLYRVESDAAFELVDEFELEKGEDAPMSMAAHQETKRVVCGINSSLVSLETTKNQNCRKFRLDDGKLSFEGSQSTLTLDTDAVEDDFQKVTLLSADGKLVAAAGTKDLSLLHFPSLEPAATSIHLPKSEIYDATFSPTTLVIATTVNLLVYALPDALTSATTSEKQAGKRREIELELVNTIDRPSLPDSTVFYTVVNTLPPRTRAKHSPRKAFICKWDTEKWEVTKLRKVSDRSVTCFDVSPDGRFVAYGSSDYTVGILDAQTLAPLLTILKAHEFPPTTLRFNPSSTLLVSGSADNTVRIVTVPDQLVGASWSSWIMVIVTLLVILFAIMAQQMHQAYLTAP